MKLSIIVATCNRQRNLRDLLESTGQWMVPENTSWELLVVDNNSTDGTKELVQTYANRDPQRIKYLFERQRGKSSALNSGIRVATGDIIVMTDDDCLPDTCWVARIAETFEATPELGMIGGRVELYDATDKPVTIRTSQTRSTLTSTAALFSFLAGCNMAFRRKVLDAVGDFDVKLGPGGHRLNLVAEDVDFLYRVYKKGYRIDYVPDVLVYHNHGRKTDSDVEALTKKYVRGRGAFYCKHILRADTAVLRLAYWELRRTLGDLARRMLAGKPVKGDLTILWALCTGASAGLAPSPSK